MFIAWLQNPAKRMTAERFHSLTYTCLVTSWLDDQVSEYLHQPLQQPGLRRQKLRQLWLRESVVVDGRDPRCPPR